MNLANLVPDEANGLRSTVREVAERVSTASSNLIGSEKLRFADHLNTLRKFTMHRLGLLSHCMDLEGLVILEGDLHLASQGVLKEIGEHAGKGADAMLGMLPLSIPSAAQPMAGALKDLALHLGREFLAPILQALPFGSILVAACGAIYTLIVHTRELSKIAKDMTAQLSGHFRLIVACKSRGSLKDSDLAAPLQNYEDALQRAYVTLKKFHGGSVFSKALTTESELKNCLVNVDVQMRRLVEEKSLLQTNAEDTMLPVLTNIDDNIKELLAARILMESVSKQNNEIKEMVERLVKKESSSVDKGEFSELVAQMKELPMMSDLQGMNDALRNQLESDRQQMLHDFTLIKSRCTIREEDMQQLLSGLSGVSAINSMLTQQMKKENMNKVLRMDASVAIDVALPSSNGRELFEAQVASASAVAQLWDVNDEVKRSMALALTEMTHDNVVKCYGICFVEESGNTFLLTQRVDESLSDVLQSQGINCTVGVHIVFQCAHALSHLHDKNIVHGDVKEKNILLERQVNGTVVAKLRGFESAVFIDALSPIRSDRSHVDPTWGANETTTRTGDMRHRFDTEGCVIPNGFSSTPPFLLLFLPYVST